jgi:16S rRNA processing protein RimM
MGRIVGPFGVKGWIKLQPITGDPASLLGYASWWIEGESGWTVSKVEKSQVHGQEVVAKLAGCDDRDAAMLYRGLSIAIARSDFPAAGENEFYWADLVGLKVVNGEGVDLGTVSRIFETGANDVLVVEGDRERLIPFTEQVVQDVDLAGRVMRVDWGADY